VKGGAEDRHFLTGQRTSYNKNGADLIQFDKNRAGGLLGDAPSITALVSKRHLKESRGQRITTARVPAWWRFQIPHERLPE
jgi:hypothetical protein